MRILLGVVYDSANTYNPEDLEVQVIDDDNITFNLSEPDRSITIHKGDLKRVMRLIEE